MTKDYARRSSKHSKKEWQQGYNKKRPREKKIPFTIVFVFLCILVFLVGAIVFIAHRVEVKHGLKTPQLHHLSKLKVKKSVKHVQAKPTSKPVQFDFYKMLPSMKVDVLPEESSAQTVTQQKNFYILQFASYQEKEDANLYQDKIRLLGFDANVLAVPQNGSTIYRVQLGPFQDRQMAEKIRNELQTQGLSSIVVTYTSLKKK